MGLLLRYAVLIALAAASLAAVVDASTATGEKMLVDAGGLGGVPGGMAFWIVTAMALASAASICKFVVAGIPSMMRDWFESNKDRVFTFALGAALCAVFMLV